MPNIRLSSLKQKKAIQPESKKAVQPTAKKEAVQPETKKAVQPKTKTISLAYNKKMFSTHNNQCISMFVLNLNMGCLIIYKKNTFYNPTHLQ
jgi:hypothetical protein